MLRGSSSHALQLRGARGGVSCRGPCYHIHLMRRNPLFRLKIHSCRDDMFFFPFRQGKFFALFGLWTVLYSKIPNPIFTGQEPFSRANRWQGCYRPLGTGLGHSAFLGPREKPPNRYLYTFFYSCFIIQLVFFFLLFEFGLKIIEHDLLA